MFCSTCGYLMRGKDCHICENRKREARIASRVEIRQLNPGELPEGRYNAQTVDVVITDKSGVLSIDCILEITQAENPEYIGRRFVQRMFTSNRD